MSRVLKLRAVSDEESQEIRKLANSRKQSLQLVKRAQIIQSMLDDPKLHAGEAGRMSGYKSDAPGCKWVHRFNELGIKGLEDEPRCGRPAIHTESVRSCLINLALQKPDSLGYPFHLWTLVRLQRAFEEREGMHLSDSTIWEWLDAEGLKWKRQQSWFHDAEKHDPEFTEKRGPSSRLIPVDVSLNPSEPG